MTTADTALRVLVDAAGEALCDSCLAFACSVSLLEMRALTEDLLTSPSFQRRDGCISCRRTVPAVAYTAKCVYCSHPIGPGEGALVQNGDILHTVCFRILVSEERIRASRKLNNESRHLIEEARRQTREQRNRRSAS